MINQIKGLLLLFILGAMFVGFVIGMFFLKSYRWGNCP